MIIFKSKSEKHLDSIISSLQMDMSNNYKDSANEHYREFVAEFDKVKDELRPKSRVFYQGILEEYQEKLTGYSHKDQKPYWT